MTREDFIREQRIDLARFDLEHAESDDEKAEAWRRMREEICSRSPQRVKEMESKKDLSGSKKVRLEASGAMLKGICPFHLEKIPSLVIDREKKSYQCFGCGAAGTVIAIENDAAGFIGTVK